MSQSKFRILNQHNNICEFIDMELFSQRKGLKPVKNVMQLDKIDGDLRNGLWNALTLYYWDRASGYSRLSRSQDLHFFFRLLWHLYFKKTIDTLNDSWQATYQEIREYYFNCTWFEVYDFVEFISKNYPNELTNNYLIQA